MNRKTFLATITALFTAPFVKSKEKEPTYTMIDADKDKIISYTHPRLATQADCDLYNPTYNGQPSMQVGDVIFNSDDGEYYKCIATHSSGDTQIPLSPKSEELIDMLREDIIRCRHAETKGYLDRFRENTKDIW